MRILYFSDIHVEHRWDAGAAPWTDLVPLGFGPDLRPFKGTVDLAVLAGDIGSAAESGPAVALDYAAQAAGFLGVEVVFVPGNHEFYGLVFEDARERLLAAKVPGVHVLDRTAVELAVAGRALRVLGATLWTDFAAAGNFREGMEVSDGKIKDYNKIMVRRGGMWQPPDALEEHMRSRFWLEDRFSERFDGPTLVVTHHSPSTAVRHPGFPLTHMSASYCSDLWELLKAAKSTGAVGWICGHTHFSMVTEIGGLPVVTAQQGYPHENAGRTYWRGPQVLAVPDC